MSNETYTENHNPGSVVISIVIYSPILNVAMYFSLLRNVTVYDKTSTEREIGTIHSRVSIFGFRFTHSRSTNKKKVNRIQVVKKNRVTISSGSRAL